MADIMSQLVIPGFQYRIFVALIEDYYPHRATLLQPSEMFSLTEPDVVNASILTKETITLNYDENILMIRNPLLNEVILSIVDLTGNTITSKQILAPETILNLDYLPAGINMITANSKSQKFIRKIFVR